MKAQEFYSTVYFTPNSFFGTTSGNNIHSHHQRVLMLNKPSVKSPKTLPKLMEQRIELPKKGKSNSPKGSGYIIGNSALPLLKTSSDCQQLNNKQQRNQRTCTDNNMSSTIFATPRRTPLQLNNGFRREQTSSISIPYKRTTSASCIRYTPPASFSIEDNDGLSVMFAGSRFIESPSAKSLPLPPSNWLGDKDEGKINQETELHSPSESEEFQSDFKVQESNGNLVHGSWSPIAMVNMTPGNNSPPGIRIHPLRLIEAAVMSS